MSEPTSTTSDSRARRAANLFDLRRVIGGLFVAYGLLLAILGLFDSDADIDKAAGVNINLYGGLAMLAFGLAMLVWAFTRPLGDELAETEAGPHPEHPAPRGVDAATLPHTSAAGGPGATGIAPAGAATPGANSASTAPPKPPPTIRAPAAPAAFRRSTVRSTSGTDTA